MKPNRFRRADGLCTVYALACGHLNAHAVGNDSQAITMGADGAVYWVKSRVHRDARPGREGQILWLTFPRDRDGYRDALRLFRRLRRSVGPAVQTLPAYRETNPKINLWVLCGDGRTIKYYASTNWWRTCRDALAYYNAQGEHIFVHATIGGGCK